jgi:Tfp pilus assembly protein PilO
MTRDFKTRKRAILAGVICLVAADLALAAYSYQLTSQPLTTGSVFTRQEDYVKKLKASVERAEQIREDMPNTQRDCEKFEHMLLPASTGYSSVLSELRDVAKKSGVRPPDVGFKPTAVSSRGLIEVAMESTIEGDYRNVILFLNGLQRSANIYEVESLALAPQKDNKGPVNVIKVGLHLKTYFRAGA